MSSIRSKDTKPEMAVRRGLHAHGVRYRLHVKKLPGRPDLVLRKYRAVIFVHGCFWHGHDCQMFRPPVSRSDFWRAKIERNRERDREVMVALDEMGWRRLTIWECALRGRGKLEGEEVIRLTLQWLDGSSHESEIRGNGFCGRD